MMNKLYILIITLLLSLTGCSTTREQDSTFAKYMIPVNVVGAYFGSVALHEAGHALPAEGFGGEVTEFTILPTESDDGNKHLGLTSFRGDYSDTELTAIFALGPTAQFVGHVSMRELLKTGYIPRKMQPTLAWFGLFNQIGYYYHTLNGMFGNRKTDLGKVDRWISYVMFGGGVLYEIFDALTDEGAPLKRFQVLFGEDFYEPKEESRFRVISAPTRGGGFLGLGFDF
jgi:hypothetical protein